MADDRWDSLITKVANVLEFNEKKQLVLGQVASEATALYGRNALRALVEDLRETGYSVALRSLKQYRWVHDKTSKFNLPLDISYNARKYMAGVDNIEKYVHLITDEGWSGPQIIREIKLLKGEPAPKMIECPYCGKEFDAKKA